MAPANRGRRPGYDVAVAVRAWAMKGSSSGAEWSPDGQSIAYQGKMGEKSGLMSRGRTARTKF